MHHTGIVCALTALSSDLLVQVGQYHHLMLFFNRHQRCVWVIDPPCTDTSSSLVPLPGILPADRHFSTSLAPRPTFSACSLSSPFLWSLLASPPSSILLQFISVRTRLRKRHSHSGCSFWKTCWLSNQSTCLNEVIPDRLTCVPSFLKGQQWC